MSTLIQFRVEASANTQKRKSTQRPRKLCKKQKRSRLCVEILMVERTQMMELMTRKRTSVAVLRWKLIPQTNTYHTAVTQNEHSKQEPESLRFVAMFLLGMVLQAERQNRALDNRFTPMFVLNKYIYLSICLWQTLEDFFSEGRKEYQSQSSQPNTLRNRDPVRKLLTRSIRFPFLFTSPASEVQQFFVPNVDYIFTIF